MIQVVVDTSILIDFTRTKSGVYLDLLDFISRKEGQLIIPTVVIFEYWRGRSLDRDDEEKNAEILFKDIKKTTLTESIAKTAGALCRNNKIEAFDAIIVATALEENALVATLNTKHFTSIPGLRLWQPSPRLTQ